MFWTSEEKAISLEYPSVTTLVSCIGKPFKYIEFFSALQFYSGLQPVVYLAAFYSKKTVSFLLVSASEAEESNSNFFL